MVPYYIPVIFMLVLAVGTAGAILVLTHLFGLRKHTRIKDDVPYEAGVDPSGTARLRFDVRFYVIAMIFVVFDLEVVYFYPWAMAYRELAAKGMGILYDMLVFAGILAIGFIYAWRKGALDWR